MDVVWLLLAVACLVGASLIRVRNRSVPESPSPERRLQLWANRTAVCGEFTAEQMIQREKVGIEIKRKLVQRDLAKEIAKLPNVEPAKPQPNIVVLPIRRRA
jgi:hypothetical protein